MIQQRLIVELLEQRASHQLALLDVLTLLLTKSLSHKEPSPAPAGRLTPVRPAKNSSNLPANLVLPAASAPAPAPGPAVASAALPAASAPVAAPFVPATSAPAPSPAPEGACACSVPNYQATDSLSLAAQLILTGNCPYDSAQGGCPSDQTFGFGNSGVSLASSGLQVPLLVRGQHC